MGGGETLVQNPEFRARSPEFRVQSSEFSVSVRVQGVTSGSCINYWTSDSLPVAVSCLDLPESCISSELYITTRVAASTPDTYYRVLISDEQHRAAVTSLALPPFHHLCYLESAIPNRMEATQLLHPFSRRLPCGSDRAR